MFDYSIDSPPRPTCRLVLAHGAGAGKDSEFMQQISALLVARGIEVVRFNFAYMQTIEQTGKRRPPEKAGVLLQHFTGLLEHLEHQLPALPLWLGGKSMGGRMATMLVDQTSALGAVAYGYPFHPPGKPDKLRTEHLVQAGKPVHIFQGERDTFGIPDEVNHYELHSKVTLHWLEDGDHSLKPRKKSGYDYQQHLQRTAEDTARLLNTGTAQ